MSVGLNGFDAAHLAWVAALILKYALECCLSGTLHSEIKSWLWTVRLLLCSHYRVTSKATDS